MSLLDVQTVVSVLAQAQQQEISTTTLPSNFPTAVNGKLAWVGADFDGTEFIYNFAVDEIAEIIKALDKFKELGVQVTSISKHNFVLPTLAAKLEAFSHEVHVGRGFIVLRGLNASMFSGGVNDLTMAFMGISLYMGDLLGRQDSAGNTLVHVIADKNEATHHRHGTDAITHHTEEAADVVAWLTRGAAAVGGQCVISSSATIYNVLAATRPDLVRVLARGDFPFALPRYQDRAVIFEDNGRVLFNFGRAALLGSSSNPRKPTLPTITAKQQEALDAIETIARATELAFDTQAGDLHFINNMQVLHRRDGYTNSQDQKRHLVRMNLSDSVYGTKVPILSRDWKDAFGDEGGRSFHIEPMPAGYFPLRKFPN